MLVAVQALTAILVYVPAARIAEHTGKKPFVIATFVAFALFPLAVVSARSFGWLVAAFVGGGLLWRVSPAVPFYLAAGIGAVGVFVFAATVDEAHAS